LGDTAGALDTLAATSRALDPQKPRIVKNTAAEAHPQIPQLWNMRGNSRIQLKNGRLIDMITGAWAGKTFPKTCPKKDSTHIENSRCPKKFPWFKSVCRHFSHSNGHSLRDVQVHAHYSLVKNHSLIPIIHA